MEIKKNLYRFRHYLYVYLILIIQISLVNNGLFFSLSPNLLLIYVAYISQKYSKKTSYAVALLAGIFYDALLSSNFGVRALVFFVIAILINKISEYVFSENFRTSILYTSASILVYNVMIYVIYYFLSYKVNFSDVIYNFFSANTLLSILIFYIFGNCLFRDPLEKYPKSNKLNKILKFRKGNSSERDSN
ncbi:rod shape-determining protein MreD [Neofamilia massiliensis]|uniref:rod shape-determining protein MreD n=1 Tax=Neofamilia massiliensis TaxID=1673724 RepID=UPI0006BB6DD3|nr:rod shape-determining protein MreD [Neofamilia massiliensis]